MSSPISSVRSNVSSRPAGSDSVSITSSEPQSSTAALGVSIATPNAKLASNNTSGPSDFADTSAASASASTSPANPWDKDIDFGDDPFFSPSVSENTGNVVVDNSSPWGVDSGANILPAGGDSWAAFGSSNDWASSDKADSTPQEGNPWGASDSWADSSTAATDKQESLVSDDLLSIAL